MTLKLIDHPQLYVDSSFRQRMNRILNESPRTTRIVLDCGCGDAFLLSKIGVGMRVGVDLSLSSLRLGLGRDHSIDLVCASLTNLPFKDETFDEVIMMEVLEHLRGPEVALKEARRIMISDSRLLVTVPNANYPFLFDPINKTITHFFRCSPIRRGILAGFWYDHRKLYDEKTIDSELHQEFDVQKIEGLTHLFLPLTTMVLVFYTLTYKLLAHRYIRLPKALLHLMSKIDYFNDIRSNLQGATTIFATARPKKDAEQKIRLDF